MSNKLLVWIKENYEKLVLGLLLVILIITAVRLFSGVDRNKAIEDFKIKIQPTGGTTLNPPPPYEPNFGTYLIKKDFSQYQPLIDKNMFFPTDVKKSGSATSQMNLGCTGVVSDAEGILTATFGNSQTGNTYKAKVGDKVENFTVVSITRDVVILSDEVKQYRLIPSIVTMPFKLTGIMPIETGFQAMLQNDSTKKTYFASAGDEVEGWKILSINENKVIISRSDSGKYELKSGGESQRIKE